jgi:hypothetical protein
MCTGQEWGSSEATNLFHVKYQTIPESQSDLNVWNVCLRWMQGSTPKRAVGSHNGWTHTDGNRPLWSLQSKTILALVDWRAMRWSCGKRNVIIWSVPAQLSFWVESRNQTHKWFGEIWCHLSLLLLQECRSASWLTRGFFVRQSDASSVDVSPGVGIAAPPVAPRVCPRKWTGKIKSSSFDFSNDLPNSGSNTS